MTVAYHSLLLSFNFSYTLYFFIFSFFKRSFRSAWQFRWGQDNLKRCDAKLRPEKFMIVENGRVEEVSEGGYYRLFLFSSFGIGDAHVRKKSKTMNSNERTRFESHSSPPSSPPILSLHLFWLGSTRGIYFDLTRIFLTDKQMSSLTIEFKDNTILCFLFYCAV